MANNGQGWLWNVDKDSWILIMTIGPWIAMVKITLPPWAERGGYWEIIGCDNVVGVTSLSFTLRLYINSLHFPFKSRQFITVHDDEFGVWSILFCFCHGMTILVRCLGVPGHWGGITGEILGSKNQLGPRGRLSRPVMKMYRTCLELSAVQPGSLPCESLWDYRMTGPGLVHATGACESSWPIHQVESPRSCEEQDDED